MELEEKGKYNCRECVNKATALCSHCHTICSHTKESKPTYFVSEQDFATGTPVFVRLFANDVGYTKPPLGVMPRYIADGIRAGEISEAIKRYLDRGKAIPNEWIDEYNEICNRWTDEDNNAKT